MWKFFEYSDVPIDTLSSRQIVGDVLQELVIGQSLGELDTIGSVGIKVLVSSLCREIIGRDLIFVGDLHRIVERSWAELAGA